MYADGILQRKQKDVQKENDFYIQLLQKALPQELQNSYTEQKGEYKGIDVFGPGVYIVHFCICIASLYTENEGMYELLRPDATEAIFLALSWRRDDAVCMYAWDMLALCLTGRGLWQRGLGACLLIPRSYNA